MQTNFLTSSNLITAAADAPSAGGAEIAQVILATALISGLFGLLALAVIRHRAGTGTILARASAATERLTGLPGWASLPIAVATVSLIVAAIGMYWDISIHIDNGRDAGPLANIAHYPILFGLMGIFASGWLAIFLPPKGTRPGPAPIRLGRDWHAPVGGVLIFLCGGFSLAGFPLDDVWHRIFGQDVTLWGPTHLMLLGGAAMTLIGQGILLNEGLWTKSHSGASGEAVNRGRDGRDLEGLLVKARRIGICGGLLIGVSIYQAEFDFGVPQFRMVFEPAMLALASGLALVVARLWIGRGGALLAVTFFLVVRGLISIWTGPVMGQTTPMVPLYFAEAASVEILGLVFASSIDRGRAVPGRLLAFGGAAGAACGTVGFAAQWGLSHLYMPIPWTSDLLPEGIAMALAAGVAGGVLGALLASGMRAELPSRRVARTAFVASMLTLVTVVGNGLLTERPSGTNAAIAITEESGTGNAREGVVSVRFNPDGYAEDASWATVTSWQGGGLEVVKVERASDGSWRSESPVPLGGEWKSMLRVQTDRQLAAVPVFLPEDPAIPAPEVPAPAAGAAPVTREVVTDKDVLQREAKTDVAGWLWAGATGLIGLMYLTFLTAIAIGVGRVGRAAASPGAPGGASAARATASQPHTPAGEAEEVGVGSSDGEAVHHPRFA